MTLRKTLAICSATIALLGLAAAPAATADESTAPAVAAAVEQASVLGSAAPGAHGAAPGTAPWYTAVSIAEAIARSSADGSSTPVSERTLEFSNSGAPEAVTVEVSYRQSDGGSRTQVSPLLPTSGPQWTAPLPGDAWDVDITVRSASGAVLAERSYPGEMPDGNPTIYWEYRSYFNLPGYTFGW